MEFYETQECQEFITLKYNSIELTDKLCDVIKNDTIKITFTDIWFIITNIKKSQILKIIKSYLDNYIVSDNEIKIIIKELKKPSLINEFFKENKIDLKICYKFILELFSTTQIETWSFNDLNDILDYITKEDIIYNVQYYYNNVDLFTNLIKHYVNNNVITKDDAVIIFQYVDDINIPICNYFFEKFTFERRDILKLLAFCCYPEYLIKHIKGYVCNIFSIKEIIDLTKYEINSEQAKLDYVKYINSEILCVSDYIKNNINEIIILFDNDFLIKVYSYFLTYWSDNNILFNKITLINSINSILTDDNYNEYEKLLINYKNVCSFKELLELPIDNKIKNALYDPIIHESINDLLLILKINDTTHKNYELIKTYIKNKDFETIINVIPNIPICVKDNIDPYIYHMNIIQYCFQVFNSEEKILQLLNLYQHSKYKKYILSTLAKHRAIDDNILLNIAFKIFDTDINNIYNMYKSIENYIDYYDYFDFNNVNKEHLLIGNFISKIYYNILDDETIDNTGKKYYSGIWKINVNDKKILQDKIIKYAISKGKKIQTPWFIKNTKKQTNNMCIICFEKKPNIALFCGHILCKKCFLKIQNNTCFICRKEITGNIKLYM
ncbi:RING finger domain protein [Hokovirus HKV1]|uniref:RING finger domain protein n=1 Tax=Hokovirus HKV1 TaxID=1977638 RepID=A0A1V0SEM1_9VIRU|nr:RING finger domain protein [Hokovirus HKV1]